MNNREDVLLRAITEDGLINCFACITTNLTDEARRRHHLFPVATAALGRLMTGGLMMATQLKAKEKLVISIKGTGPIGGLSVEARPDGTTRGFVQNPQIDIPSHNGKLAVGDAVGGGFLYITRFLEEKGRPYQGVVEIVSGEISEDLTYYLATSEQTPAVVSLGVFVQPDNSVAAAGGVMIQALPGATDDDLCLLEKNAENLSRISEQIRKSSTPKELIEKALDGLSFKLIGKTQLAYSCTCNEELVMNALHLLTKEDIKEMLDEENFNVTCQFCGEIYTIPGEALESLMKQSGDHCPN